MNVYVEDGLAMEIHYRNDSHTEMFIWLTDKQKPYFLSVQNYAREIDARSPYKDQICKAVLKFINQEA